MFHSELAVRPVEMNERDKLLGRVCFLASARPTFHKSLYLQHLNNSVRFDRHAVQVNKCTVQSGLSKSCQGGEVEDSQHLLQMFRMMCRAESCELFYTVRNAVGLDTLD